MRAKVFKIGLSAFIVFAGTVFSIAKISFAEEHYPFGVYIGTNLYDSECARMPYDTVANWGFNEVITTVKSVNINLLKLNGLKAYNNNWNRSSTTNPIHWFSCGHYSLWQVEDVQGVYGFNLQTHGGIQEDSTMAWHIGTDTAGYIVTGPSYYQDVVDRWWGWDRINYVASFKMRIDNNTGNDTVARINVVYRGTTILASDTLFANQFPFGRDTIFTLPYSYNQGDSVFERVGFQIYWYATRDLSVDWIQVYDKERGDSIVFAAQNCARKIFEQADLYKDSTQIIGYGLIDEPYSLDSDLPYRFVDSVLAFFADSTHTDRKLGITASGCEKHFIERANPNILMRDFYPLWQAIASLSFQQKLDLLCSNLNRTRCDTDTAGSPFYYCCQAFGDPGFALPTPNELECFTNLGFVYKPDGFYYFKFNSFGPVTGLVEDSGTYFPPTENGIRVRDRIMPRLKVIAPIIKSLSWLGACVDSSYDSYDLVGCGGGYIDSIRSHSPADEPHWVQVGFFENQSADTSYFMLVNRECLATEGANYDVFVTKTGGPYQIRDMYTDSVVDYVNGTGDYFTIYLGPGEGKLLRLEYHPPLFKPPVNYAGFPYYASDISATDLDNDGDCDLAVANYYYKFSYSHAVTIFKNRGDGAFDTTGTYFPGHWPLSLSAADYNKDGDKDLAVANYGDNTVSIFENNGSGAFSYLGGNSVLTPEAVISADFNNDGYYDLAVSLSFYDSVAVLMNNRYGWFNPVVYYYTGGTYARDLFAADFNGDTIPDLAIPNYSGDNLSILINNGNGTFQAPLNYSTGKFPIAICGADLDNDGDCDLVVANQGGSPPPPYPSITIFKNIGNGTFYSASNYVVSGINHIVTADFDLDSDFDLAFTSGTTDSLFVWLNMGNGTFQPAEAHFVGGGWWEPLVASDLNGDGAPDLAIGRHYNYSDDVAILINLSTNLPPNPFSLISPSDNDTIPLTNSYAHVNFQWEQSFDPEGDSLWYALYISRSPSFRPESTIVHTGLLTTYYSDSLQVAGIYYWKVKASDKWGAPRWSDQIWSFYVKGYMHGDANGDGTINSADIAYLINYLFVGGPAPNPLWTGDANCDGGVNSADVAYLINYLFVGGPPPC